MLLVLQTPAVWLCDRNPITATAKDIAQAELKELSVVLKLGMIEKWLFLGCVPLIGSQDCDIFTVIEKYKRAVKIECFVAVSKAFPICSILPLPPRCEAFP